MVVIITEGKEKICLHMFIRIHKEVFSSYLQGAEIGKGDVGGVISLKILLYCLCFSNSGYHFNNNFQFYEVKKKHRNKVNFTLIKS